MLLPQKNTQFGSSAPSVLCINSILSETSILAVIPKWRVCFLFPAASEFHFMLSLFCIIISRWVHTALFLLIYLFCFWLCWVCTAAHGLSLVAESRGFSRRGAGFSLWWLPSLQSTGCSHRSISSGSAGPHHLWPAGPGACRPQQLWPRALQHGLGSCGIRAQWLCGMWNPSRPGIEPLSPALEGRLFLLYHQGNPGLSLLKNHHDSSDFLY